MSTIQSYLRDGGTIAALLSERAIKSSRHPEFANLVLLKYNQIDSPFADPIVRQCRGVILDESDNWRIVSRAFDKFFNHGEGHAAPIDWPTARVQEKVDGSLCVLYWYAGQWRVATSGMPHAGGQVNGMGFTFADLFWRTFKTMGLSLPSDQDLCFSFELTSPWNRVVVQHSDERVILLAVRNRETGQETKPEAFADLYPVVKSYPLQSIADIEATFAAMNPLAQEGYVIVDAEFNRIKVKHPGYVAIHHARDGFGPRRMLEIVRSGETSELLTAFPEWRGEFERVKGVYDLAVAEVAADFERLRAIEIQKDFAIEAVKTRSSATLFLLRAGKTPSVRQHFAEIGIDRLMGLLKVKDTTEALP